MNTLNWISGGILLAVIGAGVAGVAFPGTEESFGVIEETGNPVWFVFGLIVAGVGQLIALIGAIAHGVFLGNRKFAQEAPPASGGSAGNPYGEGNAGYADGAQL